MKSLVRANRWIGEACLPAESTIRTIFENTLRAVLVLFTATVALKTPYFGNVLGTVGGFTDATVSFVLPPLIFLTLNRNNPEVSQRWKYFNMVVFAFGCTLVLKTTYTIVMSII